MSFLLAPQGNESNRNSSFQQDFTQNRTHRFVYKLDGGDCWVSCVIISELGEGGASLLLQEAFLPVNTTSATAVIETYTG